ncbi:PQQ-binding-like beta-propeller repeat protein [Thermomonospora umbrina]|uniref:Putative pyrroloquinoline-quinone binding quinoprotein n=1 Tax=Thermomonospora umbrina TaxID=111806 RepID=A0A3D9SIL5_9ACTN|nr:PQQ-binding-like beta-propeller repeat protein [Thermomonospora umbrina]REE95742.1 putative pyrroloquinoline-quinone binding quinoprotein [Thermomonospora umbrina]
MARSLRGLPPDGVPVRWRVVIGVLAALLFGVALTLQARGWTALIVEAGGSCGSRRGVSSGTCPRGSGVTMGLAFVVLVIALPVALVALIGGLKARLGTMVLAVVALAGIVPGQMIFAWAHGPTLGTVWQASGENPDDVEGQGSWLHGSTVVRARFDRLTAYDIATGDVRWTFTVPAPAVLCAMSGAPEGGTGAVGYGEEDGACARLAAVDLTNGRPLWTKDLAPEPGPGVTAGPPRGASPNMVALTRDAVVVRTGGALRAFGLRDGADRWTRPAGKNCEFDGVIGGSTAVLAELRCPVTPQKIVAVDVTTGRSRWETPAPLRSSSADITLLSAAPAVARVHEGGKRGIDAVLSFDDAGRTRATIEVEDGPWRLTSGSSLFEVAPLDPLMVLGDRLVARASGAGGRSEIRVYGLTDGRRLWSTPLEDIEAVHVEPSRVLVLTDGPRSPDLTALSMRDGAKTYLGTTRFRWLSSAVALYSHGDRYVLVAEDGTGSDSFPVAVVKE